MCAPRAHRAVPAVFFFIQILNYRHITCVFSSRCFIAYPQIRMGLSGILKNTPKAANREVYKRPVKNQIFSIGRKKVAFWGLLVGASAHCSVFGSSKTSFFKTHFEIEVLFFFF